MVVGLTAITILALICLLLESIMLWQVQRQPVNVVILGANESVGKQAIASIVATIGQNGELHYFNGENDARTFPIPALGQHAGALVDVYVVPRDSEHLERRYR